MSGDEYVICFRFLRPQVLNPIHQNKTIPHPPPRHLYPPHLPPHPHNLSSLSVAFGGGLELALTTTFRVFGSTSTVALPETRLAIIPGAGLPPTILGSAPQEPEI